CPRSRSVSVPSCVTKTSPCWKGLIVPGSTLMYGSSLTIATLRPRASRIAPKEAAAMPLPKEDTTPPVTNTKRVINLKGVSRRGELQPRAAETDDGQTGYHNARGPGATLHSTTPTEPSAPSRAGPRLNRLIEPQIRDRQHALSGAHQRQARALAWWHVSFLQQALERTSRTSPPRPEPLPADAGPDGQLRRQGVQVERTSGVLPELELTAGHTGQLAARLFCPAPSEPRRAGPGRAPRTRPGRGPSARPGLASRVRAGPDSRD